MTPAAGTGLRLWLAAWASQAVIMTVMAAPAAPAGTAGCMPAPLDGRDLYLRGSFNHWAAADEQRFVWFCNRYELVTRLDGEHRFKIGDEAWSADADLGGEPGRLQPKAGEMRRRFDGVYRLRLDPARSTLQIESCPRRPPFGDRQLRLRSQGAEAKGIDGAVFRYHCDAYLMNLSSHGRHTLRVVDDTQAPPLDFAHGPDGRPWTFDFHGAHTLRLALDAQGRPQLSLLPLSFADPSRPAVDDPVALSLRFDSRAPAHKSPFGAVVPGTAVDYRVDALPGVQAMTLVVERRHLQGNQSRIDYETLRRVPMTAVPAADGRVQWSARHVFAGLGVQGVWFEAQIGGRRFALQNNRDAVFWTHERGSGGSASVEALAPGEAGLRRVRRFRQTVYAAGFQVPDWAADAVYYYVFPERFRNGDKANDPRPGRDRFHAGTVEAHTRWLDKPFRPGSGDGSDALHNNDFFGGDLAGLIDKLPYIQSLGANALYLTPIFLAASNHKYDTADYRRIDPAFGTEADLRRLTQQAQRHGIRIVLDASLNHTGADSLYFDRYANHRAGGAFEGGQIRPDSPYAGWYRFDPTQTEADKQYQGWVGVADLPELDKDSRSWRDFAYGRPGGVMQHWLDRGTAGWRMDVAPWVPDGFWREWRAAVKAHSPDAITIAETWFDASHHLSGDMFDSTMNYIFRNTVLAYAAGGDARALVGQLELMRENYPPQAFHALMNLLSSHDQARSLHVLGWHDETDPDQARRAKARFRLALFFQMSYPGAPAIYYGDEVGLGGGEDPDNRRPYPWADEGGAPDLELLAELRRLTALRHAHPVLRRGQLLAPLHVDAHVMVLARRLGPDWALTLSNNAEQARRVTVTLPPDAPARWAGAPSAADVVAQDGRLTVEIPALSGLVLFGHRR